jgi:hypothetical protein
MVVDVMLSLAVVVTVLVMVVVVTTSGPVTRGCQG